MLSHVCVFVIKARIDVGSSCIFPYLGLGFLVEFVYSRTTCEACVEVTL